MKQVTIFVLTKDLMIHEFTKEKNIKIDHIAKSTILSELIKNAPEKCLLTGRERCDSYYYESLGVTYLSDPAYTAYSLPEFDRDDLSFSCKVFDMDDGTDEGWQTVCDLSDLITMKHSKLDAIIEYYQITEEEINKAKEYI